jgi:hypothetical protein
MPHYRFFYLEFLKGGQNSIELHAQSSLMAWKVGRRKAAATLILLRVGYPKEKSAKAPLSQPSKAWESA